MTSQTNNSMRYSVSWGNCGDYDKINEYFSTLKKAQKYYDKTVKEESDIWIELSEVLQHHYCSEQMGDSVE